VAAGGDGDPPLHGHHQRVIKILRIFKIVRILKAVKIVECVSPARFPELSSAEVYPLSVSAEV
jgi:hypothetical protein